MAFFLGLLALVVVLVLVRGFTRADIARVARSMRLLTGGAALVIAVVLGARGLLAYALPIAMFGSWLVWSNGGRPFPGRSGGAAGRVSRVTTDHLDLELDLDSGETSGSVLKGVFAGRDIRGMAPAELALLWQDCRFADPRSAELVEAYLDRVHPTWKEDMSRAEAEPGAGGVMSRQEALDVLGLKDGATAEEIRRAHRELMLKMHPDRGGSTYLAAKINEAKDFLLR
jgi:hypothetical protein